MLRIIKIQADKLTVDQRPVSFSDPFEIIGILSLGNICLDLPKRLLVALVYETESFIMALETFKT
jgi:hypothetical protein